MEKVILAGGCFWCTEAIFSMLKGVSYVTPGYSGGYVANPTYEEVSKGSSGHAESVLIEFNPKIIKLSDLLYVFFKLHDPTTLNRQGEDVGTQYRSAIFYANDTQKNKALAAISRAQKNYKNKIVTEVIKFRNFFPADPMHKEYYFRNRLSPYCILVIDPKIQKLKKEFRNLLR